MSREWYEARVLAIGGAGFVGSNLTKKLLDAGAEEIVIVDNLLSSELENIPKNKKVSFLEGSITSNDILNKIDDNFDFIFHLATYHGNQSSIHNPLEDHENNTLTTLKLCEKLQAFKKVKKVVYSSAGCTVAEKTYGVAHATTEDAPISLYLDSPYQISKIIGEFYLNYYYKQYDLPVVKARFQNVYGPGEILGAGKWRGTPATVWRNVVPTFIYRAINQMPLLVENSGLATRDFIYVDDIVRGLMLCATNGEPGEVYNLASGTETSILELSGLINEMTDNPTPIELGPKRKWDNSGKRFGSIEKSKKEIRFEALVSLPEGLKITTDWTYKHLSLIKNCINKHANRMPQ